MISRRTLLKSLAMAVGCSLMPLGRRGWALAAPGDHQGHMIVILMRGAVDGLSIVAPYSEPYYYEARSSIALNPPGQSDGLLPLDGGFGLHPSLDALMPLWQNQSLAFIHASGSPSQTRSHFEAQDIMETAMLNSAMASQGWMNALAGVIPNNQSSTRAVSFGNVLPKICQGPYNFPIIPTGIRGRGTGKSTENPQLDAALSQLYGTNNQLGGLYKEGTSARTGIMNDLQNEMQASAKGAPQADAFVSECSKVADMISHDPSVQLVFMDVGGWDTHVQQGNAKGQLANRLQRLGNGLASLAQGLGAEYKNTTILIMSEFGRTVAQNGNGGTDHGHGNVAWLMGGRVRGGKVYGRWPGLDPDHLWQGRDLAVTTDFRSVVGMTIAGQFGMSDESLARVIPAYQADPSLRGIIA